MKIEKIKIQNFYSFKDASVNFGDYRGLTVIKGKNKDTGGSNGSGKSVLVEAVYFGLTGKTIRKSTEDSLVNNVAKKHCMVEIHLTHNNERVIITRHKKPTRLEFHVGEENRTKDNVGATQAEINSVLNINHKVLLASMFFGQSNDVSFLDSTADDKRTIIRNFLNLEDLFSMRDKIKTHKSTFYQGAKEKEAVIAETIKNINNLDKKIETIAHAKKAFSTYDEYTLSLSLEDILDGEKKEFDLDCNISAQQKEIGASEDRLEYLEEKLKNPSAFDFCEKCQQPIIERYFNPDEAEKEMDVLKEKTTEKRRNIKLLEDSRWTAPITSREFVKVLEYKDLCRDETNYEDMKTELLETISTAEEKKNFNKTWYEVMRFWEKAFSEQGVIKYIIANVLEYFNERCNFYLSYLTNSKYFVEFDQELNEKIETDGRLVQYISLSGGEKRKINLAIMLGLKDLLLLTDSSHVDLLFFDEVAENIDEEGVQGLHQLLQEIKKNKTVFVITHNKYLKTLLDSSPRLSIIKKKGLSTLKA